MVKKDAVVRLNKEYKESFITLQNIEVGNHEVLKKGTKVNLLFVSNGPSIKVYAYPVTEKREEVLEKNILYLFRDDFPNGEYSEKYLKQELAKIVKPL